MGRPKILFAVLDWGLGHASRSAPLIQHLADAGAEVFIASSGNAGAWLKTNFPQLNQLNKPGIDIAYSKRFTSLRIAMQGSAFLKNVVEEQKWVQERNAEEQFDLVLSDNCYGIFLNEVPSILITHQLNLPLPKLVKQATSKTFNHLFNGFNEVWIPDTTENSLAGKLSENSEGNEMVKFIGPISNLHPSESKTPSKLVGMVSGPEPHRTLMQDALEQLFLQQNEEAVIIGGIPGKAAAKHKHVSFLFDPTPTELAHLLQHARLVICRAGYSSLMDLVSLQKSAVLIPTPDQKEQEYLAEYWSEKFGFTTIGQRDLSSLATLPISKGKVPKFSVNTTAFTALDQLMKSLS